MNIEVEGCCDVGVAKQYAYSLIVAVALDAACGKAVAQSVHNLSKSNEKRRREE